jgi:three-Cys-motif partner protein
VTTQDNFGGSWTQQKLEALGKYLRAYRMIFDKNPSARFYSVSYVDAFAGTGTIHTPEPGPLANLLPELQESESEFRKGSVRRALEIEPPFHAYVFIEKSAKKCRELQEISRDLPPRNIEIINADANSTLLKWCEKLDTQRQRAVVFLDPFGASVSWDVIEALGRTRAVDLWVLFPYSAINRMLTRDRKPPSSWAQRLTAVFGTPEWEKAFYSTNVFPSLLDSMQGVELVSKSVDYRQVTEFFVKRLTSVFAGVSKPLPLHNSNGSLLFVLFFAAGNKRGASTGLKIANSIIGG